MNDERSDTLFRCGRCLGSGEIYHDSDIGTVYCDRCDGTGNGVLLRYPVYLAKALWWLTKWGLIMVGIIWGGRQLFTLLAR